MEGDTLRRRVGRFVRRIRTGTSVAAGLAAQRRLGKFLRRGPPPSDLSAARVATTDWVRRAFDATDGKGASASYHVVDGWAAPYPEITGYLIPTLLRMGAEGDSDLRALAIEAGHWLARTQLPDGAIIAKQFTKEARVGSVFNTAQVIEGWCALYRTTGDADWLGFARSAADWVCALQEPDGRWIRGSYLGIPHSYYSRAAWPLLVLAADAGEARYRQAAVRHLRWILRQQDKDGWIRYAGFGRGDQASTHTIAYTLEGLLEAGILLGDAELVDSSRRGAEALRRRYEQMGVLSGEFANGFRALTRWRCVTGDAQMALVWARLSRHLGIAAFSNAARQLAEDIRTSIQVRSDWPEISGALPGSRPDWGDYDPYRYPTHAAKFFLDLLDSLPECKATMELDG